MTELPEPFHLTLDAFLKGPGNEDAELDIDRIFGKPIRFVLADIVRYDEESYTPEALAEKTGSPSLSRPGYRFVEIPSGVALLDDRHRIVGAYASSDLSLKTSLHGFGLGRELVTERALRFGTLPTWSLDIPAYSPAGLAAHQSAWQRAHDDPAAILDRMEHIS